MLEEVGELLKAPLEKPLETKWQVIACQEWRKAELALTTAKGRLFDPSLSSEDKRKNALAYGVRNEQHAADSWRDIVAIMVQQVEHGRPLI